MAAKVNIDSPPAALVVAMVSTADEVGPPGSGGAPRTQDGRPRAGAGSTAATAPLGSAPGAQSAAASSPEHKAPATRGMAA